MCHIPTKMEQHAQKINYIKILYIIVRYVLLSVLQYLKYLGKLFLSNWMSSSMALQKNRRYDAYLLIITYNVYNQISSQVINH